MNETTFLKTIFIPIWDKKWKKNIFRISKLEIPFLNLFDDDKSQSLILYFF